MRSWILVLQSMFCSFGSIYNDWAIYIYPFLNTRRKAFFTLIAWPHICDFTMSSATLNYECIHTYILLILRTKYSSKTKTKLILNWHSTYKLRRGHDPFKFVKLYWYSFGRCILWLTFHKNRYQNEQQWGGPICNWEWKDDYCIDSSKSK